MFEIELEDQIIAVDPHFEKKVQPARPAPAPTTEGPNRFTVYVPTDNATLSLGQACDQEKRINDIGLTGRTDTHMHFQVTQSTPTIITLGWPVWSETYHLPKNREDEQDKKVSTQADGYSMVTAGNAWHEAKKQHLLVSQTGNIMVRARAEKGAAVLQADVGTAEVISGGEAVVAAKKKVSISAFNSFVPTMPTYGGEYESPEKASSFWDNYHTWSNLGVEAWKYVRTGVLWAYDWWTGRVEIKRAKVKEVGWEEKPKDHVHEVVEWTNNAIGILSQYEKQGEKVGLPTLGLGVIEIDADGFIEITACVSAGMHGQTSVAISSLLSAEVLGGADAGVTGLLYANLTGGLKAKVSGRKDAAMEAETGKVAVRGHLSAEVSSDKGPLRLQGHEDVLLTSVDKGVCLYGKERVQVTAGSGSGFGVKVEAGSMHMGKIASGADKLEPPTIDKKQHILFEKGGAIVTKAATSHLELRNNSSKLYVVSEKNMVYVTHQNVKVKANGKILLG